MGLSKIAGDEAFERIRSIPSFLGPGPIEMGRNNPYEFR
jgi:hypothetical protein